MLPNQLKMSKKPLKIIYKAEDCMRSIDVIASFFNRFYVWQSPTYRFYGFLHRGSYYVLWSSKLEPPRAKIRFIRRAGLTFYLDQERDIFDYV